MYPELTLPLVVLFTGVAVVVLFLLALRPVLRRLALRQIRRRPIESVLVVLGSLLGTALIVASLAVGDSLDRSIRQGAYEALGPIDVAVRSSDPAVGDEVAARLAALAADPDVDGLLTVRVDRTAAVTRSAGGRTAEPRTLVWDMDFAAAARFGAPGRSGLAVPAPGPDQVVINEHLAAAVGAGVGDRIEFFLYGRPLPVTVAAVVPAEGLAGAGLGGTRNRNAFLAPGTLLEAAAEANAVPAGGGAAAPTTLTYVSNRGGVEDGVALTDRITARVADLLGPAAAAGAWVQTPKRDMLDAAEQTAAMLGSVFLFIACFSIIAGILLIMNIFVMLAEERRGQLGTLRAIGMRRRRVSGALAVEGAVYSGAAVVLGGALGIGIGRVIATLAGTMFNSWESPENQLDVVFAVSPVSVANGMLAGFLIAFVAVVLTSVRIARTNVIAAIRDLEPERRRRTRRGLTVLSAAATAGLAALAVPAVAGGVGADVYLLPALAAAAAIPLLRRFVAAGTAYTLVAVLLLGWGMTASLVRPGVFADVSTATYVVLGTMLTFGAVVLISQHQTAILRPVRRLVQRPTQNGLAARLAVAYPTGKRFRTGATLAMYCIVVLVIVMLTQLSAAIDTTLDKSVADATGEWSLRADYNPSTPPDRPTDAVTTGRFAGRVAEAVPLVYAPAFGDDPLGRTAEPLPVVAVGVPRRLASDPPGLQARLPGLTTDTEAWRLVLADPSYVLVDAMYGATGGPPGASVQPGDAITLEDPATGRPAEVTVAGVLAVGSAFYGIGGGEIRYPVLMGQPAARRAFGDRVQEGSLLLRLAPGARPGDVAAALQADLLRNGMVVTDVGQAVRDNYRATSQFFLLMQGYLALGLVVGISGLGVIMVRAVRERRRTIAVLRALGFRAATVRRAFLAESLFVALEGVVLGTVLGVAVTWVFYQNGDWFGETDRLPYPVAWLAIGATVTVTLLISLLVTIAPARRAAATKPAAALRVAG